MMLKEEHACRPPTSLESDFTSVIKLRVGVFIYVLVIYFHRNIWNRYGALNCE